MPCALQHLCFGLLALTPSGMEFAQQCAAAHGVVGHALVVVGEWNGFDLMNNLLHLRCTANRSIQSDHSKLNMQRPSACLALVGFQHFLNLTGKHMLAFDTLQIRCRNVQQMLTVCPRAIG